MGGKVVHERGAGIAWRIWPSAHFLLDFLVNNGTIWKNLPESNDTARTHLLELGAGVGLVGICCAAQLPLQRVTLTDIDLDPLIRSVEANDEHVRSRIKVERLGWGEPLPPFLSSSDLNLQIANSNDGQCAMTGATTDRLLVVASDVVYWESLAAPLADSIRMLCTRPGGAVVYISHRKRDWRTERRFFTRLLRQRGLLAEVVAQAHCIELGAEAQDGEARILLASDAAAAAASAGAAGAVEDADTAWNTRVYKITLARQGELVAGVPPGYCEIDPEQARGQLKEQSPRAQNRPAKEKKKRGRVPPRQEKTGRRS